jgi:hypothetical protein
VPDEPTTHDTPAAEPDGHGAAASQRVSDDTAGHTPADTAGDTPGDDTAGDTPGDDSGDDGAQDRADGEAVRSGEPAPTAPRGMLVERAAARGVQPGPPPRRTGVFVDVDELRAYVGQLLQAMLGGYEVDALGNMTFTAEGARIFVTVGGGQLGPQVGVFSITNIGVELVPDLAAFLLRTNLRMAFGSFAYEPEQEGIWLRHTLLGGTLDGPELRGAILSIASTASQVADMIADKFGTGSFEDEPEDVRRNVHPPDPADDDTYSSAGYL